MYALDQKLKYVAPIQDLPAAIQGKKLDLHGFTLVEANKVVEKFINENSDISSIIDAPIGTNRFGNFIDNCSNIKSFIGIDFSDDMLNYSKIKNNNKLKLKKKDIINEKCDDKADLVLAMFSIDPKNFV